MIICIFNENGTLPHNWTIPYTSTNFFWFSPIVGACKDDSLFCLSLHMINQKVIKTTIKHSSSKIRFCKLRGDIQYNFFFFFLSQNLQVKQTYLINIFCMNVPKERSPNVLNSNDNIISTSIDYTYAFLLLHFHHFTFYLIFLALPNFKYKIIKALASQKKTFRYTS